MTHGRGPAFPFSNHHARARAHYHMRMTLREQHFGRSNRNCNDIILLRTSSSSFSTMSRSSSSSKKKKRKHDSGRSSSKHARRKHSHHHRSAVDDPKLQAAIELLKQKDSGSGLVLLTEEDFFQKNDAFREWLLDKKGIYLSDLSKKQAAKHWKRFMRKWNQGSLSSKYYKWDSEATNRSSKANPARTKFQWNIQCNKEESQYIHTVKRDGRREERTMIAQHQREGELIRKRKQKAATDDPDDDGTSMMDRIGRVDRRSGPRRSSGGEQMDKEDQRRYERGLLKQQRKRFNRHHQAVMEELVPKKTGRERMLEKKKMKGAYARADRDDSPERNESEMMGGSSDSFRAAVNARNARVERRKQARQNERAQKMAEYKRKEDEKMAVFREMLKNKSSASSFVSGGVEHT